MTQRLWHWRAGLAWCVGGPLACVGSRVLLQDGGLGPGCLFKRFTGCDCPLCGGTHALRALSSLDLAGAWQAQAGLVPLLLGGWLYLGWLAWRAGRGPQGSFAAVCPRRWPAGLRLALGFWLGEWLWRLASLWASSWA